MAAFVEQIMDAVVRGSARTLIFGIVTAMAMLSLVADGGAALAASHTTTVHSMPSRVQSSCAQPPSGIDLTMLSDNQLAVYGLPSRAELATHMGTWRKLLAHAKHRVCDSQPIPHRMATETSISWAGNVATGGGYNYVSSEFHVPTVGTSPASSSVGFWVGLDGDASDGGGSNLVQAGVGADVDAGGGRTYYTWWTSKAHDLYAERVFFIGSGDDIYVSVDSNYHTPGYNYFYIEDYSIGQYYSQPDTYAGYLSNGSTSEWIAERVDCPSCTTLSSFTDITFQSDYTLQNGNGLYVGQTQHNASVACNRSLWTCGAGDYELMQPLPIDAYGSSFAVHYLSS